MKLFLSSTMLLATATLILASGAPCWAADNCYVKVEGAVQGWIQGDSTRLSLNRENHIEGLEFHHLVEIPEDLSPIDHQTVILTKLLDKATPRLLRAMDTNEQLTVQFRFFRPNPDGSGTEQEYYEVLLEEARLVSIEPLKARTDIVDTANLPDTERIRFSYGQITVTWHPTGDSYTATSTMH